MTTHFLDEADLLADRIAILSKGTLRAEGSSVELKERLGSGYRIHLPTGPEHPSAPDINGVTKHITFGQAMYSASSSRQAAQIIKHLEGEGITDYQLSGPTIEDVFLQLADEVRAESVSNLHTPSLTSTDQSESAQSAEKKPHAKTTTALEPTPAHLELHSGNKTLPNPDSSMSIPCCQGILWMSHKL
jgi:ATP-binding cassette subfamily A (ABC1) protein 3